MTVDRIAHALTAHRKAVGVIMLGITALAFVGLSRLQIDDDPRALLASRGQPDQSYEEMRRLFGGDDDDCLIVIEGDDVLAWPALSVARQIHNEALRVEGAAGVYSLFSVRKPGASAESESALIPASEEEWREVESSLRPRLLENPFFKGNLLAPDGKTMFMVVAIAEERMEPELVVDFLDQLKRVTDDKTRNTGLRARLTGIPALRAAGIRIARYDLAKFALLAFVFCNLVGIILFRQVSAIVIVSAGPVLGALWTLGAIGWMGIHLNLVNNAVIPLVQVVGLTDSVHLMLQMRRRRGAGDSAVDAVNFALRRLLLACLCTSITTAIGFGSLTLSELESIHSFGIATAFGVLLMFVAVIGVITFLGTGKLGKGLRGTKPAPLRETPPAYLNLLFRFPGWITLIAIIVTGFLLYTARDLRVDTRVGEALPRSNEAFETMRHIDNHLGGMSPIHVLIRSPENESPLSMETLLTVSEAHDALDLTPAINFPVSILTLFGSMPGQASDREAREKLIKDLPVEFVNRFVHLDSGTLIVSGRIPDVGAEALQDITTDLNALLAGIEEGHPGYSLGLTGSTVVASLTVQTMIDQLAKNLALGMVIILVVVTFFVRSIRLGLISIIPNVLPLTAVAAFLVFIDTPLQYATAMVFSIAIGIAVDDTIHFLNCFRLETAAGLPVREAVRRSLRDVGSAVILTTILMLIGFGTLMLSSVPPLRGVGFYGCLCFLVAIVGDLIALPAMLLFFLSPRKKSAEADQIPS